MNRALERFIQFVQLHGVVDKYHASGVIPLGDFTAIKEAGTLAMQQSGINSGDMERATGGVRERFRGLAPAEPVQDGGPETVPGALNQAMHRMRAELEQRFPPAQFPDIAEEVRSLTTSSPSRN